MDAGNGIGGVGILQNPAYAGAFVYGRTRPRNVAREGGSPGKMPQPIEEWRIVVRDRYPAYIDWPAYETNPQHYPRQPSRIHAPQDERDSP